MCVPTQDNDNRVRTMSHRALGACAVSVKSSLAPHLKSLIASWVSGMCDPYGPAATAAKMAFEEAFPSKKQNEVLEFAFKAIFKVRHSYVRTHVQWICKLMDYCFKYIKCVYRQVRIK